MTKNETEKPLRKEFPWDAHLKEQIEEYARDRKITDGDAIYELLTLSVKRQKEELKQILCVQIQTGVDEQGNPICEERDLSLLEKLNGLCIQTTCVKCKKPIPATTPLWYNRSDKTMMCLDCRDESLSDSGFLTLAQKTREQKRLSKILRKQNEDQMVKNEDWDRELALKDLENEHLRVQIESRKTLLLVDNYLRSNLGQDTEKQCVERISERDSNLEQEAQKLADKRQKFENEFPWIAKRRKKPFQEPPQTEQTEQTEDSQSQ